MKKHFLIVVRDRPKQMIISVLLLLCCVAAGYRIAEPIYYDVFGPLKQTVIVIDPGHGGIDPGAQSEEILEKEINLDIAKKLRTNLNKTGAKVILTRESDQSLDKVAQTISRHKMDLMVRLNIINNVKPDFFISIHVNTSPRRPKTTGPMVFYNRKVPGSETLAKTIQTRLNGLAEKNGFKPHQIKTAEFFLLKNSMAPGAIVEVGFMTNTREKNMLRNNAYRNSIATEMAQSVQSFCSEKGISPSSKSGKETVTEENEPGTLKIFYPSKETDVLEKTVLSENCSPQTIEETEIYLKTALDSIFNGTTNEPIQSVFGNKARVLGVNIKDGIATINLPANSIGRNSGTYDEVMEVKALVETSCQFSAVNGVRFLFNGQKMNIFGDELDLSGVITPESPKLKVAIVIDDVSSNNEGLDTIVGLNRHITMSVLPKRPLTKETVDLIHRKGIQMFLHLPMEPESGLRSWLGEGAITSQTSPEEIPKIITEDLKEVPFAVGINNHMGSKVTKRKDLMYEVLKVVKNKKLIFLDSLTTSKSVVDDVAKELGISVYKRSVFIDDTNSYSHACNQIEKIAEVAKKKGHAIAIGHVGITGKNTARALRDMLPWLEDQGIELVYVTELK